MAAVLWEAASLFRWRQSALEESQRGEKTWRCCCVKFLHLHFWWCLVLFAVLSSGWSCLSLRLIILKRGGFESTEKMCFYRWNLFLFFATEGQVLAITCGSFIISSWQEFFSLHLKSQLASFSYCTWPFPLPMCLSMQLGQRPYASKLDAVVTPLAPLSSSAPRVQQYEERGRWKWSGAVSSVRTFPFRDRGLCSVHQRESRAICL